MTGRPSGGIPAVEQLAGMDAAGRRVFFQNHPELKAPSTVTQLAEAARARVRVNAVEALELAEAALAVAEDLGDDESRALGLRAKANASWFLNRNHAAIELYDRAAALFEKLGNQVEVGRTISSSIQPLIRTGDYARALKEAERAREIFRQAGDGLRLTRLELNVANIHHRQDRFEEALAIYDRAYRQLVLYKDTEGVAVALHNMAVCLIPLNDFPRALETYQAARAFFVEHEMPALVFQVDYNVAYLYQLRGVYSRALRILQETQEACRLSGDAYHGALCRMDQSEIYLELNMSDEAAEMASEAFQQFQTLEVQYEAAKSLANLAIAMGQRGKPVRSLELFARAREIFLREDNQVWARLLDLYQAMTLYQEGRFAEARGLCSVALEFFHERQIAGKEVLCHLLLARLALRGGDWTEARAHCGGAMERLRELEAPHLEYLVHFQMGQIEEAAGDRLRAAEDYRAASSSMESLRSLLHADEIKIAFMKNKVEVYEGLIRLCLAGACGGPREQQIFDYMEAAKSRSLRDLMYQRAYPSGAEAQSGAARDIQELRGELNWYYHRLAEEQMTPEGPSRDRTARIRQEMSKLEGRLMRLLRELPAGEREATGLKAAPPLGLEAIQAALRPDTAMIEYFHAGERVVGALITRSGIEVFPLAPLERVKLAAKMLHFQLSKFGGGPSYLPPAHPGMLAAVNAHLRELYEQLLAPMLRRCEAQSLVFVPHDLLHQLPLHALFDGGGYVIDRFQVTYAPSASVFALCQAGPAVASQPALVLGVPDAQAPFIAEEVRAVCESVAGARQFIGEKATLKVLEELGPGSRLIHIATHGRFRRDNPVFSSIRLGDAYLTLYDLNQLRLPADLVTLSGCSTGLNVVAAGDELMGLVRGLLRAGARSLLLSLWDIHDRTTADFMRAFYQRLQDLPDRAAALQAAMWEIRERQPHPYFWAPFFLTGSSL